MNNKIVAAVLKADTAIMALCEPEDMSKEMAIDFLEQVIERCQSAIEALQEEIKNGDG